MISKSFARRPLLSILLLAAILRIVSACYSEGYLMHDDHFWAVESSASWTEGADYNRWMPWTLEEQGREVTPHYTNLVYPGLHYIYFSCLKVIGLNDPMAKMLVLRIIHGLISLIAVFLAFRITETLTSKHSDNKATIWVGLMMASLAWLPIVSVHQLVEITCIVPLLAGTWVLVKRPYKEWKLSTLLISGLWLGMATGLRYQVGVMGLGVVAAIFISHSDSIIDAIKKSAVVGMSALIFFALTQVPTDIYLWGEPFAQLKAYINYNLASSGEYPQGNMFTYLFVLLLLVAPPFSLALIFGYLKSWRKLALLVLPSLVFIIFHSLFPNKQERFILPAIPYVIIAGTIFWVNFRAVNSFFSSSTGRLIERSFLIVAIVFNSICLVALSLSAKNTSQMSAMYEMYNRGDMTSFIYVSADHNNYAPRFYSGAWEEYEVANSRTDIQAQHSKNCNSITPPNYLVFVGDSHLGDLVSKFQQQYVSMEYVKQFRPGRLDRFIHYLNPKNPLKRVLLYKTDPTLECSEKMNLIENE